MKNLSLITAIGQNLELGYQNNLIWRIKEDLQFFKKQTLNSYIIMGRLTYESLPKKLMNRKYIVLSHQLQKESLEDTILFNNINECLGFVETNDKEEFFVIGGAQIYKAFLPFVSRMHLTEISASFKEADAYFPEFEIEDWDKFEEPELEDKNITYKHTLYLRKSKHK